MEMSGESLDLSDARRGLSRPSPGASVPFGMVRATLGSRNKL